MWREENVICHYIVVICISASRCCFFPPKLFLFFSPFFGQWWRDDRPIWSRPNVPSSLFSFLFILSVIFLSFAVMKVGLMTGKVSRWKTKQMTCAPIHLLFFFTPFSSMFLFLFVIFFWIWMALFLFYLHTSFFFMLFVCLLTLFETWEMKKK